MDPALPLAVDSLLEHSSWMRVLAVHLVRDAASADDVVQEAYLAALRRARAGRQTQRGWLARVVYNQAALHARSERNRRTREERSARDEALPSSVELAARAELQKRLVEAVLELRDPYRSVLLLRFYEDLSPQEIAKRLGVPSATIRSQLTRGVALVRDKLDANHGGDRRAWSLALVPLAAQRAALVTGAGTSTTLLASLVAMSPSVKIVSCALIAIGLWLALSRNTDKPLVDLAAPLAQSAPSREESDAKLMAGATSEENSSTRELVVRELPAVDSPLPIAHLRGRVVTRQSNEPVAHHPLTIFGGPTYEALVTGEDGSFECPNITAEGSFSARLGSPQDPAIAYWLGETRSDDLPMEEGFNWAPGDDDVVVRVLLEPTYRLAFAVPAGLAPTDFEARLEAAVSFPLPPGYLSVSAGARVVDEDGPIAHIVFGARSYATFAREGMVWRITLLSADGLWKGTAPVARCFGACADLVRIDLEPTARLALELVRSDGGPVLEPKLDLVRARDPEGRRLESEPISTSFVLRGLEPGNYHLVIHAAGCEQSELDLELAAGMALDQRVTLHPDVHAAAIRGELHSRSRAFREEVRIVLTSRDRVTSRNVSADWVERDGQWVAPFEFEGLVEGTDYTLSLAPHPPFVHRRWSPDPGTLRAPAAGLVFVVEDEEGLDEVIFNVEDALSHVPLEAANVILYAGGEWVHCLPTGKPGELRAQVGRGASLRWFVQAKGYARASGTEADLPLTSRGRSGVVALQPGWGVHIVAHSDGPDAQPLAGVEIRFDGRVVGVTDESGTCDVLAEREPERVEVRLVGWRWSEGGGDPSARRLRPDFYGVSRITLARQP